MIPGGRLEEESIINLYRKAAFRVIGQKEGVSAADSSGRVMSMHKDASQTAQDRPGQDERSQQHPPDLGSFDACQMKMNLTSFSVHLFN